MNQEHDVPDLLTFPEASGFLRLKLSTLRAWRLQGRIPVVKLGSRVFIQRKVCLELIERNVVNPSRDPESRSENS